MKQQYITSKVNYSNVVILFIGGIAFLAISIHLLLSSFKTEYPQLIGIIMSCLFGFFGVASIGSLLFMDKFVIDGEILKVNSVFGFPKKIIYLKNILSYTEIEKETKHNKWKDLTIYSKSSKVKLSSSMLSNYSSFRKVLIKGKAKDISIEQLWIYNNTRRLSIGIIVFGLILSAGMLKIFTNRNNELTKDHISSVSGQLTNALEIQKSGGKNSVSKYINLELSEYPDFVFKISGHSYNAANPHKIINQLSIGKSITIDIKTDSYEKKLQKSVPLTFFDKSINYSTIQIYGLRSEKNEFLRLADYNIERKADSTSWGFWIFMSLGLGFVLYGIILSIKNKKPAANIV